MSNQVVSLLHEQLKGARQVLMGTMDGVTSEQAHWSPPGKANPLGATYAHVLTTEDGVINAMVQGGAPLFASSWAGKVGVSEMAPGPSPDQPGLPDWGEWARSVEVDVAALGAYAQAVFAASDEYIASLSDADLDKPVDLSAIGLGERTVGSLIGTVISNTQWHTGEIACLKGLQGEKGYPF